MAAQTEGPPDADGDLVLYRQADGIVEIVLNRPHVLNAISDPVAAQLRAALERFDFDEDAHAAVFHGNGRAFCSGADVRQRQLRPEEEMRRFGGPQGRGPKTGEMLFGMTHWKPVIAAVHGHVVGAGLRLALLSDLIVAAPQTVFKVTEVPRGVDGSIFWRLLNRAGAGAFADEVCLTGRPWSAEEGAAAGVIAEVSEPGEHVAAAREIARQILQNPPLAVRQIVRVRRAEMLQLELAYSLGEAVHLHHSEDFKESARAFAEKRPHAPWRGR